jgi:hypothetical protein
MELEGSLRPPLLASHHGILDCTKPTQFYQAAVKWRSAKSLHASHNFFVVVEINGDYK